MSEKQHTHSGKVVSSKPQEHVLSQSAGERTSFAKTDATLTHILTLFSEMHYYCNTLETKYNKSKRS